VWNHIDEGSCPGQGIGVRTRLENGLSGFILTKNLSDKPVNTPEERVNVSYFGKGRYGWMLAECTFTVNAVFTEAVASRPWC